MIIHEIDQDKSAPNLVFLYYLDEVYQTMGTLYRFS